MKTIARIALLFLLAAARAAETPQARPQDWAQRVGGTSMRNLCKVSDELYRSDQPKTSDIASLRTMGIQTIISLRHYHHDSEEFARAGIAQIQHKMDAGSVSTSDLITVLRHIRSAKKPVLLHCWHGSDRTGFIVAGYRMVVMEWDAEKAIEELRKGGYGYHETFYPDIAKALRALDVRAVRHAVI